MHKEYLINKDLYEVHDEEKIWSKYWKKYLSGCINKYGYVQVILKCIDGKQRIFQYHRAIWYLLNGEIPDGYEINHIDENKQNNALSNLSLVTHKENINYGTRNERVGKSNAIKLKNRKLSEEIKAKIRIKMIGRKLSEETKRKESESKKGHIVSEETRAKISASLKGRIKKQATNNRVACGKLNIE